MEYLQKSRSTREILSKIVCVWYDITMTGGPLSKIICFREKICRRCRLDLARYSIMEKTLMPDTNSHRV
ncbi:hypothetical protein NY2A_b814L [Paramecium bursaria Chlorella virus NY2A]|uniref:Uncharacterized protein b814L n=1 Tax=Paramecium bursaria Chlorella virus NY2A TaxID=46021 RepID=A7IXY9_PBCVN|nr:hypothetical protein NY2A_b814L [Paramecium bursaria Chlorella virus NY2A]ABT15213.1 hypothetical protein NY2A_b814L [Paramecium bursaria Chlorella virus NY2A]